MVTVARMEMLISLLLLMIPGVRTQNRLGKYQPREKMEGILHKMDGRCRRGQYDRWASQRQRGSSGVGY